MMRFGLIILFAVALRVVLFFWELDEIFSTRNEIATPITSYKRVKEGLYLVESLNISPYEGYIFHQPPLLLAIFYPFSKLESLGLVTNATKILYILLDVINSLLLYSLSKKYFEIRKKAKQNEKDDIKLPSSNFPEVLAALYLFNPLTLSTCIGMSTIVFNNTAILFSLYFSIKGKTGLMAAAIAFSAYLTIYPLMLIIPLILISRECATFKREPKPSASVTAIIFFVFLLAYLILSYLMFDSFDFLMGSYGFTFLVTDLTPNIGLFWYYFTEMFEHFTSFYLFVFQFHVFVYAIPLSIRIKQHPLFLFWILVTIISTFKAYPVLGDTSLHMALVPLIFNHIRGLRYGFVIIVVGIYVVVLAPIFWTMWIYQGTGNANFYYAINLVFAMAQILLISDSLTVCLQEDYRKQKEFQKQQKNKVSDSEKDPNQNKNVKKNQQIDKKKKEKNNSNGKSKKKLNDTTQQGKNGKTIKTK